MIIHRVWAQNVLKYATLELDDLPPQGLIGVSGANESGKSTIGETICFALFGRTYSYAPDEIVKVIRWGEPSCAVTVDFSVNDQRYTVSRSLDDQGNQGVRLSDPNETTLERGIEPVRNRLETLLGFGFDEFIESFYLAQREITTPHPHSMAVKKMAGIAALEQVAAEATEEIRQQHTTIGDTEHAMVELEQRMTDLNVDASLLPRLRQEDDDLQRLQAQDAQRVTDLQEQTAIYREVEKCVTSAVAAFGRAQVDDSYLGWRAHVDRFQASLDESVQQSPVDAALTDTTAELKAFAHHAAQRLSAFDELRQSAAGYRQSLAVRLGHGSATPDSDQPAAESLPDTEARLQTQLNAVLSRYARVCLGVYIFLPLALLAWVIWGVSIQTPGSAFAAAVSSWVPNSVWLPAIAGLLSVLFLYVGLRGLMLRSKIAQLRQSVHELDQHIAATRQQADALDGIEEMPLSEAVHMLVGLKDEAIAASALQFQQNTGGDLIDAARYGDYQSQLHRLQDHFIERLNTQYDVFAAQIKTIQGEIAARRDNIEQLDTQMGDEQVRHQQLHELQAEMGRHQDLLSACQHRIQIRELACDLSANGARYVATTFNRDIRDLVSRTLPLLTQGRYEHLKIDENLDVQVFSSDKRDFMQLEEISTGTQRQIMLAVRLALSQQFVNSTLNRQQFIFLDEPFAFFDEPRTRSALQSLGKLSDELKQIWIVAQAFPAGFAFDLEIRCGQGRDVLNLSAMC
jgi:DNA repair exonuclease SbcCD ATPase subunit